MISSAAQRASAENVSLADAWTFTSEGLAYEGSNMGFMGCLARLALALGHFWLCVVRYLVDRLLCRIHGCGALASGENSLCAEISEDP